MRSLLLIGLVAVSGLPAAAHANKLPIECPDRIALDEKAQTSYGSWEVTADKAKVDYHLESMRVFDGHPREMASLVPDKSIHSRGRVIETWQLPQTELKRGYWIACAYRNSMTLLTKRLPDSVKRCQLTQKTLTSGALAGVESFVCE